MKKFLIFFIFITLCFSYGTSKPKDTLEKVLFGTLVMSYGQSTDNYMEPGGSTWVIGGTLNVISGGTFNIASGATASIGTAFDLTAKLSIDFNDTTDGIVDAVDLSHTSLDDNPTAGDGIGLSFELENDANTVEEWFGFDFKSTSITDGSEDGDIIFNAMLGGTVTQVLMVDSSDQSLTIGANSTDADGIYQLRIFPVTASKGSFRIQSVANTGDTDVVLSNASHGQATSIIIPDSGAATSYIVQSTAALTLAEVDVLDGVTPGTASASKALIADGSIDVNGINTLGSTVANIPTVNIGASGTVGALNIFPSTAASGKIYWLCADNAADHTLTFTNASHAQATVYTFQDAGTATADVVTLAAGVTTAGELKRADLTEEPLQIYGIPINDFRAADGAVMGIAETAGDHYLSLNTNVITMLSEVANSETETSVSYTQFIIPPEYVSAGDVKIRIKHTVSGAGTSNDSTVDFSVYEQTGNGAVGADLVTTDATITVEDAWTTTDFTVTSTGLVPGDILIIRFQSDVIENAAGDIQGEYDGFAVLLDIKG